MTAIWEKIAHQNLDVHIASRRLKADEFHIPHIHIDQKELDVEFSYPLPGRFVRIFRSGTGFDLATLVDLICEAYKEIYDELDAISENEIVAGGIGKLKYGHNLEELWLTGLKQRGDGIIELSVDSAPSPWWLSLTDGYGVSVAPRIEASLYHARCELSLREKSVAQFDVQGSSVADVVGAARTEAQDMVDHLIRLAATVH